MVNTLEKIKLRGLSFQALLVSQKNAKCWTEKLKVGTNCDQILLPFLPFYSQQLLYRICGFQLGKSLQEASLFKNAWIAQSAQSVKTVDLTF